MDTLPAPDVPSLGGAGGAAPASENALRLSISVEALVWILLGVLGALVRLLDLTGEPLTVAEAARSLDAALVARGSSPDGWNGDLTAAVTAYLFRAIGESDGVARLAPAVGGAMAVPALWWLRQYAGRAGALAAAALLAFSPLSVLVSRSALPYATGVFLSLLMVGAAFAYLKEPRPGPLFLLALGAGLSLLADAVSVTTGLAIVVFLAIEAGLLGSEAARRAWVAFRSSPLQMGSVVLVTLAALQLGLTRFGTSLENTGLPGVRLWSAMFDTPRDTQAPEYYLALLVAYDWPLFAAGVLGLGTVLLDRPRDGSGASAFKRFLVVWTCAGALILALASRRDAGQALVVLLPLSLLAGVAVEKAVRTADWGLLRRWWPLPAGALLLWAYAAMLMTRWSAGNAGPVERFGMVMAAGGGLFLLAAPLAHLGRRGVAMPLVAAAAAGLVFTGHSAMAVTAGGGTEFARGDSVTQRAAYLGETLARLKEERGGTLVVDADLRDALGWTLRDSGARFGGRVEGASIVVGPAGAPPPGFAPLGGSWRVAEGWYPEALLRPRGMWRWLVFREPYGAMRAVEVSIFVPAV